MSARPKSVDLSLLKIDVNDLVKQICLKDMELFKAIPKEEIDSFYWTKASKKNKCPKLMMSTKQFNKISIWVQNEILNSKDVKVLSKFIQLSKGLLDHKNFQSAYAVKAALDSATIHRLEQLWTKIDKKSDTTWKRLCVIFSVEDNYQNLRKAMAEKKPPLIPYLGVYLGDLTGLDAAHPKVNGVESEIRKSSLKKIYDSIWWYQQSRYDFKPHIGIQNYIQSMEYMEEFENIILDTYFSRSKELEPDNSSKASDSSSASNLATPQIQIGHVSDYSPMYKKRHSPKLDQRCSYRVLSENERKLSPLIQPDSPTITNNSESYYFQSDSPTRTLRHLLDDSEVITSGERNNNTLNRNLKHTHSSSNLSSNSLFGVSPTTNLYNNFNSLRKPEIERKSYVQYQDPDILTTNQKMKLVLTGIVKRKLRSKPFGYSSYHVVLAKLFENQLECCLNFYMPKITKPRVLENFKEDYHENISLLVAELKFEQLINSPKIIIQLPHETYVIQSADDDQDNWPSLHSWFSAISDSKNSVTSNKAAACQPQCNLINLDDEFTRL